MCLCTVASSNQQLHIFSQFSLIVLIRPCATLICIRHEVFALAHEGMWQSAIAGRATVNCILRGHAGTGTLVPGKSTGTPQKTTPRKGRALFRMVRQDRFISARALTARMRNLYGMKVGRRTINNQLLSRGYSAFYKPTRKPLLTANHHRHRLEWAQSWQNLTMAHWQHVIFGDESRFHLYSADSRLRYVVYLVAWFISGKLFTVVPNRLLCSPTDTSLVSSTWAFCETP